MRVEVHREAGQIGVRQQAATLQIKAGPGRLSVKDQTADLNMQVTHAEIKIDMSRVYSEIGLKGFLESIEIDARKGQQEVLKGIARIAREGDRLAAMEPSAIPNIARQNYQAEGTVETNIGLIPRSRPKIDVKAGSVEVRNRLQIPKVDYNPTIPQVNVRKGYIEVYLDKPPVLDITVSGQWIKQR